MAPQQKLSRLPAAAMLSISAALVVGIGLAAYQNGQARNSASEQARISREVHDSTGDLLSFLQDAETGQRGYLLTGRDPYLEPYTSAVSNIPDVVAKLRSLTTGRKEESERVSALEQVVAAKLGELAQTIQLRRTSGMSPALEIVDSGRGKALMDDIRTRCAYIRDASSRRASEYASHAEKSATTLTLVATLGSSLLLAFLAASAFTIFRGLAHREHLYREAWSNAQLLKVTLSSIGDGVIATDRAARITFINPVALALTGWTSEEALQIPIREVFRIVNETTRATVENPLEKALKTGEVVGLANHTVLIAKDGTDVPIDDSGAPIRDADGEIHGAVLVFRNISARRHAERQLKESNRQLEEFVAAAAHDLRSPLRSVHSMAELLAHRFGEQIGSDGRDIVGFILGGAGGMLRLLEDLLAYARASHFEPLQSERTSLDSALRTVLENLRVEIETSGARISAEPLPNASIAETHAVQLFQNLIGNALKYRSDAPPDVRISCNRKGSDWLLRVSDNGIGIESQYFREIFKPFRRVHVDDRPGSGIGLATCQKIANGYGGRIWVDSEPGKGSTFFVTVPAGESCAALGQEAG